MVRGVRWASLGAHFLHAHKRAGLDELSEQGNNGDYALVTARGSNVLSSPQLSPGHVGSQINLLF